MRGERGWEWQKVSRRNYARSANVRKGDSEDIMTFFFRNFPESCSSDTLRQRFGVIGRVAEIVIPEKRDKRGHKFGFVRFFGKGSEEVILEKLNRVWFGSYIIRAYRPRFDRPMVREEKGRSIGGVVRKDGESAVPVMGPRRVGGISYAEIVSGRRVHKECEDRRGMKDEETVVFQSEKEEGGWLCDAFTGLLKEEFSWREHGEEIRKECGNRLSVKYMGGGMVLLQSGVSMGAKKVLEGFEEWSRFWLEWWKPWASSDVNQRREVWTRWTGVPLQAWSSRFFGIACAKFGNMVELHEATKNKLRFDVAFVKVSTGLQSCDRILPCNIDGAFFSIKIEEVGSLERVELASVWEVSESDSEWSSSDFDGGVRGQSVEAMMEGWSEPENGEVLSVNDRGTSDRVPRDNNNGGGTIVLETEKSAAGDHYCKSVHADGAMVEKDMESLEESFNGVGLGKVDGPVGKSTGEVQVGLEEGISFTSHGLVSKGVGGNADGSGIGVGPLEATGLDNGVMAQAFSHNSSGGVGRVEIRGEQSCEGREEFRATSGREEDCEVVCGEGGAGLARIGAKKKSRAPLDPCLWEEFARNMASSAELAEKKSKRKGCEKGKGQGVKGKGGRSGAHGEGVEGWNFGKRLGLVAVEDDARMHELMGGVDESIVRLGKTTAESK